MEEQSSAPKANPLYAKIAAIINGVLCSAGVLIAAYVYLHFPHHGGIQHGPDKFGHPVGPESIESYIFIGPAFQIWLFIMPAHVVLRWSSVEPKKDNQITRMFPSIQGADPVKSYNLVSIIVVVAGVLCFGFSSYRSFRIAMGGI